MIMIILSPLEQYGLLDTEICQPKMHVCFGNVQTMVALAVKTNREGQQCPCLAQSASQHTSVSGEAGVCRGNGSILRIPSSGDSGQVAAEWPINP